MNRREWTCHALGCTAVTRGTDADADRHDGLCPACYCDGRAGTMVNVCAWCHPGYLGPDAVTISHGICEAHAEEMTAGATDNTPNDTTRAALRESENHQCLETAESIDEMVALIGDVAAHVGERLD